MTAPITVNGITAVAATLFTPWRGVWIADIDLDPDTVSTAPTSGPATLVIGAAPAPVVTLTGTIDARASGSFVASARVRVVGGAGGWDQTLKPANWDSPTGGVSSGDVYRATAQAVGETVVVAAPASFGTHFERLGGPAARVFGDLDWYVDLAGVTQVASRPSATADASLELLEWRPEDQRAELSCDTLVLPGTTLSDPRLNGATPIVRDVEQRWDRSGTRATAWCSAAPVSRLGSALKNLVREYAGVTYLKTYRYRYIKTSGNGLALQAVTPGAPTLNPIAQGTGMAGVLAKLAPSTIVYVQFVDGDPSDPIVVTYDGALVPIELDLAGGGHPVAFADSVLAELVKIGKAFFTFVPGSGGASFPNPYIAPVTGPSSIGSEIVESG